MNDTARANNSQSEQALILSQQFASFYEAFEKLRGCLTFEESLCEHLSQRKGWIERLRQEEFPVAFFGSFSAGKSTIINAILNREVLPEATKSTTAFPTLLRKGSADGITVYYLDNAAKTSVWDQICAEISKIIRVDLNRQKDEKAAAHLQRVEQAVAAYKAKTDGAIDTKLIDTLKALLKGWSDDRYKQAKQVPLTELKQYVEGHPDALFIDRVEVSLCDIPVPQDIVLVDLPGLDVANFRHIEFTKQYIREKAKAFVVCMKPNHLLEGEEIKFLEEVNRDNPTILQRSFWLINQWDKLNTQQRAEEEANFRDKIRQYGFRILDRRFFKVSSLDFLLLTCIANNTLKDTNKLKEHAHGSSRYWAGELATLGTEQAKVLLDHEEVKPFADFRGALFDYLNSVARDEFLADARRDLLRMIKVVLHLIKPSFDQYKQSKDIEGELRIVAVNRALDYFLNEQREKIRAFSRQIRTSIHKEIFWKDQDTQEICSVITERFSGIDGTEIRNELARGEDTNGDLSLLPGIIKDRLRLTRLLRDRLATVAQLTFVQKKMKFLLDDLCGKTDYIPEHLIGQLRDLMDSRDIAMRLNGVADILFCSYGQDIEKVGLRLVECTGETLEKRIVVALEKYKTESIRIIQCLAGSLNAAIQNSVKNHTEFLEENLIQLFDSEKRAISLEVSRNLKLSEEVAFEIRRQATISSAYQIIFELEHQVSNPLN